MKESWFTVNGPINVHVNSLTVKVNDTANQKARISLLKTEDYRMLSWESLKMAANHWKKNYEYCSQSLLNIKLCSAITFYVISSVVYISQHWSQLLYCDTGIRHSVKEERSLDFGSQYSESDSHLDFEPRYHESDSQLIQYIVESITS